MVPLEQFSYWDTFQSTPPGWRATDNPDQGLLTGMFQSTPPGWRATRKAEFLDKYAERFNPRLPDGGRHFWRNLTVNFIAFQSTPPGWRATDRDFLPGDVWLVSIHASRMEGDPIFLRIVDLIFMFQSTPPGWRAT